MAMAAASRRRRGKAASTDLVARGLPPPLLCVIDANRGCAGRWARCGRGRWCNSASCTRSGTASAERRSPALAEIRDDFHRIGYASSADSARAAYAAFKRTRRQRCPGVVTSLCEGGDELLTFFRLPRAQWKALRTTNVIERLHEAFRRRVKTHASLPSEEAAAVPLFSLVVSGQIKLRRIDGWRKIAAVLSQRTGVAA